jgi:hypothetical protein
VLDLNQSKLYAKPEDAKLLEKGPQYVIDRYLAIIKTIIVAPFRYTRQQAANHLAFPNDT